MHFSHLCCQYSKTLAKYNAWHVFRNFVTRMSLMTKSMLKQTKSDCDITTEVFLIEFRRTDKNVVIIYFYMNLSDFIFI